MKLEDYIEGIKNPKRKMTPEVKYTALDLDSYTFLPLDKKELIKAVFPYLREDMFMDIFERYENEDSEYAFYQTCSEGKINLLLRVKICDLVDNRSRLQAVPRDKFDSEYNRCVKVGSQKYADIKIFPYYNLSQGFSDSYIQIYYTDDGKVFIDSTAANTIKKMDVNDLGKSLAKFCIDCEKEKGLL